MSVSVCGGGVSSWSGRPLSILLIRLLWKERKKRGIACFRPISSYHPFYVYLYIILRLLPLFRCVYISISPTHL
ncbi:hypothetical protein CSUI_007768 [Cystoisospora suis]|uniref:Uncharacterized protein n=1 Tax=Cystoisospora suis TaxID=483139 RepID=A0A2C6JSX4_9APIC|nr:hypothetical protein CSUI_007768 [Cystoisospora suis]